jgi:glutaredoxin
MSTTKPVAHLYRMKTPSHVCPFGLKSRALLNRKGYVVDDHLLTSREETDAFKREHDVKTTPQTFIDGKRIGGYDALKEFFGQPVKDKDKKTYKPVIAIFAISMCILAIQKLRDLESFSNSFLGYDLLARKWVRYADIYPFAELLAGVLMIAGALIFLAAPVALFIGTIGAVSVFRAVYIEKRDLKCACVGGDSNVPLGFVSLTENLMMIAMAVWMLAK